MSRELRETYSDQYRLPCVGVECPDRTHPDRIIEMCQAIGAVRDIDEIEYCVELRPDIGPELWTEDALRRSVGKIEKQESELARLRAENETLRALVHEAYEAAWLYGDGSCEWEHSTIKVTLDALGNKPEASE